MAARTHPDLYLLLITVMCGLLWSTMEGALIQRIPSHPSLRMET